MKTPYDYMPSNYYDGQPELFAFLKNSPRTDYIVTILLDGEYVNELLQWDFEEDVWVWANDWYEGEKDPRWIGIVALEDVTTYTPDRIRQVSPLDRLAAEYDRKHPNGLKFTYSLDGETQQTTAKSGSRLVFTERLKLTLKINDYIAEHGIIVDTSGLDVITALSNLGLLNEEACKKYLEW